MKKVVIAVAGALMLTAGGMTATNLNHTEAATNHYYQKGEQNHYGTYHSIKNNGTVEYQELSKTVDLSGYTANVVEDNKSKRITLYKDAKGQVQYKTILIKNTGIVKVIEVAANHNSQKGNQYHSSTENQKITKEVDLSGYVANVVEDNKGKRITLYKDAKGQVQYKTILIKKTGMEKVIKMSR